MLEVSCRDLGLTECSFVAAGDTVRKLTSRVLEHARDEHPELIAGITDEQRRGLIKRIEGAAHEAASA